MAQPQRGIEHPVLFICDMQDKFRGAIHQFPQILVTIQKVLKASKILNIPVLATTQNRARLGETCAELHLDDNAHPDGIATIVHADKTRFSMYTPEVQTALSKLPSSPSGHLDCVLVGIESHICVTQTTLDLLRAGHKVYVLADGVSSCNKEEVPIALARLRHEGAVVTTSESWMYEVMGDAGIAEFKQIAKLVKETTQSTRESIQALCKI